ncbi:hypothetical protein EYC80_004765 [Monilinia laxa]|uniref:chitinase n=1 Tax=Monilinia laxa TaxID=61186 RepID=A0A5N6KI00_MONLA|nr:hypothetical protein EYC80_004765 [Monilinia laxa]
MARLNLLIERVRTVLLIFSLFHVSKARILSPILTDNSNVALYWGQGPNQKDLLHFCEQSTVDIIILSFIHRFPAQGNGWPGMNFGNFCKGSGLPGVLDVYHGPGNDSSKDQLLSNCPSISAAIPVCQSVYGKKILLSFGGGAPGYELIGVAEGEAFADFMWGAFGPQTRKWLDDGLPRPFDGPNDFPVEVDGFDFDMEFPTSDKQAGYIAMIQRLRSYYVGADKQYLITGAPQCIVPDANIGNMIAATQFDILFLQFYNTPWCSVRSWVNANPNYLTTGVEKFSHFSYNKWADFLPGTASANAKLYIGVFGGPESNDDYLNVTEMFSLMKAYYCRENFGGIMMWDATSAENNVGPNGTYYQAAKSILLEYENAPGLCCNSSAAFDKTSPSKCIPTGRTETVIKPTPTPIQPSMTTECYFYHLVKNGDTCESIAKTANISLSDLHTWNPALGGYKCAGLSPEYYLCVGVV